MAKRGRRASGEGNIWHNEKRGRWEGRITIGQLDSGAPKRKMFTGPTRAAVVERMTTVKAEIAKGQDVVTANMTVQAYLNNWLTNTLTGSVTTGTVTSYTNVVNLYIVPNVGHHKLADLTPDHVERMIKNLEADGKSGNTQRLARSVLRRALRRAEQKGVLSRNVAAIADGPKVKPTKEGRTLTPEQARKLLNFLETTDNPRIRRLAACWVVMLSIGLRRGEALGLRWDDVVLDATPPLLVVRNALKREKNEGIVLTEPKTKGSKRTLNLPRPVALRLKEHRIMQLEAKLHAGPEWIDRPLDADLVFRTEFGGPVDPDNFRQWTYQVTAQALGERWSPHELRHSAASILLAQGVPLEIVTETLGHSSIRITKDVYGHLLAPARQEAADAMTDALFGD